MTLDKTFVNQVLSEIERLRAILSRVHSKSCVMLRNDVACSCGQDASAARELVERTGLRARLLQAESLIARHQAEILRLDVALLQSQRAAAEVPRRLIADPERWAEGSGLHHQRCQPSPTPPVEQSHLTTRSAAYASGSQK